MPPISKDKRKTLEEFLQVQKDPALALFRAIKELENRIDTTIPRMIEKAVKEVRNELFAENETRIKEAEQRLSDKITNSTDEKVKILDKISLLKGDDGNTPTDKELLDLIRPLIPRVKDGRTPTDRELLILMRPLIPKVKNGHTPTKEELLDLIKPFIPVKGVHFFDGKSADETKIIKEIVKKTKPKELKAEELPKLINSLPIEPRLQIDASHIKNLPQPDVSFGSKSGSGAGAFVIGEAPSGAIDGSNTTFTLSLTPNPNTVMVYLNGARQSVAAGDHTISGRTITMTEPPLTGESILVDYEKA